MKAPALLFVLALTVVHCFRPLSLFRNTLRHLSSHSLNQIEICTSGLSLTDKLKKQCDEKISKATKVASSEISSIHLKLKAHSIPKSEVHTHLKTDAMVAEATVGLKSGKVIHMRQSSDHMYSSIDLLAHRLKYKLNRLHEKEHDLSIKKQRRAKLATSKDSYEAAQQDAEEVEEEEEQGIDEMHAIEDSQHSETDVELSVMKSKEFDLPPISVEDAVQALELIDHNFYMFRNQETNEVNVVYRRIAGGVGHINITPREPTGL